MLPRRCSLSRHFPPPLHPRQHTPHSKLSSSNVIPRLYRWLPAPLPEGPSLSPLSLLAVARISPICQSVYFAKIPRFRRAPRTLCLLHFTCILSALVSLALPLPRKFDEVYRMLHGIDVPVILGIPDVPSTLQPPDSSVSLALP